jgi:uncharacterized protein with LGFP repeats
METFQGGAIYWSPSTGAHVVYGAIGAEYQATANERDYYNTIVQQILGAPTSDEMNVPGVAGARMETFQGGAIYWSPSTGAHVVYGAIGGLYENMGGPTSYLGLPTSDEQGIPGGRETYFQGGKILWNPQNGARAVQTVSQMTFDTGYITLRQRRPGRRLGIADGLHGRVVPRRGAFPRLRVAELQRFPRDRPRKPLQRPLHVRSRWAHGRHVREWLARR